MGRTLSALVLFLQLSAHAFDWQGHRGARGLFPENSIEGMAGALDFPVTTLELDVFVSKDQKIVVSHDPVISPVLCKVSGSKVIYQLRSEELKDVECGSKPHPDFPDQKSVKTRVPLLSELVKRTEEMLKEKKRKPVSYNIEIKSSPDNEARSLQPEHRAFADLLIRELKDLLPADRYVVQSFDLRVLRHLHEKHPEVRLAYLHADEIKPEEIVKILGFTPEIFSPDYKHLNPEHVAFFHKHKVKVIPWTPNTTRKIQALVDMGVDGIITDYPNLIPTVTLKPQLK